MINLITVSQNGNQSWFIIWASGPDFAGNASVMWSFTCQQNDVSDGKIKLFKTIDSQSDSVFWREIIATAAGVNCVTAPEARP